MNPFLADGPDPDLADRLALFGQFVGSWDLEITYYDPDRNLRGEWHFAWALGGHAVQDVWIAPGEDWGTTIRFPDPRADVWRSTWIGPRKGLVLAFEARQVGEEIVLERDDGGMIVRWIFSDIAAESFHWRAVESTDAGATWRLVQEMDAVKRTAPALV